MSGIGIKTVSVLAGIFATFFKLYGVILGLVCFAIVFDIISGTVAAKASGIEITSKKASQGFWRKIGLMLGLFFGMFLDLFIPVSLEFVNVTIPFALPFGLIFGCYIVFNESISICENLYKINEDILPSWVKTLLLGGKEKIDSILDRDDDDNA